MLKKTNKHYLLTGLFSILPIAATYWIVIYLFNFFSKPGSKIVELIFHDNIPSYVPEITGFIFTIIFIYLTGLLISNVIGKSIYKWIEKILSHIPIINTVYVTIKKITSTITKPDRDSFKKVVFIEYPKNDIWTLAMVTGESIGINRKSYYHIFLPTTPNPTSGFLLFILKENVKESNMSIEEGMKTIISGGLLSPELTQLD